MKEKEKSHECEYHINGNAKNKCKAQTKLCIRILGKPIVWLCKIHLDYVYQQFRTTNNISEGHIKKRQ